jgi:exodeoxyribonuclease V beta subunit
MDMDVSVETDQCIFETTTAFQVLLLLRSVLRPADMGLRKTLILSRPSLFGPHAKLDNNALTDLAEWLRDCRDTWEKHGFAQCWEKLTREAAPCTLELPAVAKKTFAETGEAYRLCSVFESLACSSLSRRSLVDLAHVGELLITRSHRNHWDMHQLVNYASVRIKGEDDESDSEDSGSAAEEEQLRPDSTSARILVRTIHKAKGLEYNAVIVDQAFNFSKKKDVLKSGERFKGGDNGTETRIYSRDDFSKAEDAKRKELLAEIEVQRMEEDARLFYVALTRAKQKVLLLGGQADDEDKHPKGFSALFARLGLSADFSALVASFAEHIGPNQQILSAEEDTSFCSLRKESVELGMEARRLPVVQWRQGSTSYSSLSEDRLDSRKPRKPVIDGRDLEPEEKARSLPSPADQAVKLFLGDVAPDLPLKPANMNAAEFGNVLHDLLEELDFSRIDQGDYLESSVRRMLADASVLEGGVENPDDELKVAHLVAACRAWLETPISPPQGAAGSPFKLRDVSLRNRMSEARFAYSSVINADSLKSLRVCFSELGMSLPPELKAISGLIFPERAYGLNVDGLLIGFIDLVFKSPTDGKYYLLDWKTNFLGNSIRDYDDASMSAKMAEARYHLQFSLYASVLDEHMKRSVVGWNYDQHFGGIIYLFLRGFGASPQHHPRAGAFCFKPTAAFVGKVKAALNAQSDEQS